MLQKGYESLRNSSMRIWFARTLSNNNKRRSWQGKKLNREVNCTKSLWTSRWRTQEQGKSMILWWLNMKEGSMKKTLRLMNKWTTRTSMGNYQDSGDMIRMYKRNMSIRYSPANCPMEEEILMWVVNNWLDSTPISIYNSNLRDLYKQLTNTNMDLKLTCSPLLLHPSKKITGKGPS